MGVKGLRTEGVILKQKGLLVRPVRLYMQHENRPLYQKVRIMPVKKNPFCMVGTLRRSGMGRIRLQDTCKNKNFNCPGPIKTSIKK
jgi:hypothetical protein